MTGRPSLYTPELAEEICERIASGESLRAICSAAHMPSESAVRKWATKDHDGFSAQYARARALRADVYADEIIEIADAVAHAESIVEVQAARLRCDNRKWVASKMQPKKYGDKIETENRTRVATEDPLAALMESIAKSGNKVYDRRS